MPDYKQYLNPLLNKVEGYSERPYADSKGNLTIGSGLKLDDNDVQGLMQLRGIASEDVKSGNRQMAPEELSDIHNAYLDKRENLVRAKMGDLYDTLQPHEKAAVMSMGYQSLNNIGPSLNKYLSNSDKIGAMREMILNTNKEKDPGILSRRMEEAKLYGGPLDFTSTFKTMSPEEKSQLMDIINKNKNENTKQDFLKQYGSYLGQQQPEQFSKLQNLLNSKIGSTDSGQ